MMVGLTVSSEQSLFHQFVSDVSEENRWWSQTGSTSSYASNEFVAKRSRRSGPVS